MNKITNSFENIASGQEITTKERGHSFSDVVFLFALGLNNIIGFLTYLFPCLIISRLTQRGGHALTAYKYLCDDSTINTGLADREVKQMSKTVMRG